MIRLLLTMLLVLSALPVCAAGEDRLFGAGQAEYALVGGFSHAFNDSYYFIGGNARYNVMDGLGVGFSVEQWMKDGPSILRYSPFVQYVFFRDTMAPVFVSGFYRHSSIDGLPSLNSVGARAGLLFAAGETSFFSAGFVYESYKDCQESIYRVCSESYPEFSFILGF